MSTLGDRLDELKKENSLGTDAALAKFCGVSRGLVTQWRNGATGFGAKPIIHIDSKTKLNTHWIATGKGDKYKSPALKDSNLDSVGTFALWSDTNPLDEETYVFLPFYQDLELAVGNGKLADKEQADFKLPFAKLSLRRAGVPLDKAICTSILGDSMEPVLPDGATVGIDISDTRVVDGQIYAIRQDDLLRVKQLYRIPNGYRIRSFNEHKEELAATDMVVIIGRVFTWSVLLNKRR